MTETVSSGALFDSMQQMESPRMAMVKRSDLKGSKEKYYLEEDNVIKEESIDQVSMSRNFFKEN